MSGDVQTYCVLSEFMCNWCLELLRLIMSGLCSCVTDVCILSSVFMCKCYTWTQRGHTIRLNNTRHHLHMNTEDKIQTSVTHEHRPDIISMNNSRHQFRLTMSGLCSCESDVWSCSDLLWPLCFHVQLMSGVVQTYCVLSVFMCNWCLVLLRLSVSSLCSCVTDVWTCSDLLCLVCVHVVSLNKSRHQLHMNWESTQ
jgi:hypothetical protein